MKNWRNQIAALILGLVFAVIVNSSVRADNCAKNDKDKDIVETAIAAGSFKTLVTAVQAAGLVETLKGKGPFTVFAPTDSAFARLPKGTIEALLADKAKLTAVLTYHVVPGTVTSTDVVKLNKAKTVQGAEITIKTKEKTVMIDNAQVVAADILCSNGVIHVIDNVILPPSQEKEK